MTRWAMLRADLRRRPVVITAIVVWIGLFVLTIVVPLVVDTDPNAPVLTSRLVAPNWAGGDGGGLLGTDPLGRDLLLQLIYGLRTSFLIAGGAMLLAAVVGTIVGLLAGYFGGLVDALLMRYTDVQLAFPGLLLVIIFVRALGRTPSVVVLTLGLLSWPLSARIVRSAVLQLRSTEMVVAHVGLGATAARILGVHVFPNVLAPLASVMTLDFARLMLAEASLSFVGFGLVAPDISLGLILGAGRQYVQNQWWVATFSGLALAIAVLATNLIGNWLQGAAGSRRPQVMEEIL